MMPLFGHQCLHLLCLVNTDLFDTVVHNSAPLTLDKLNSLCLWKLHLNVENHKILSVKSSFCGVLFWFVNISHSNQS